MLVDGFRCGYLATKDIGRRLKETFVGALNDTSLPAVLKPIPIMFSPIKAAILLCVYTVLSAAKGFSDSAHDIEAETSFKESIGNRFKDLKDFDKLLKTCEGVFEESAEIEHYTIEGELP